MRVLNLRMGIFWNAMIPRAPRGVAALLVLFVLAFCLSGAIPIAGAEPGCHDPEPCLRICTQSSTLGFITVVVIQQVLSLHWAPPSTGRVWIASLGRPASQFRAGPFTPRAPPFSLA